MISKKDFLHDGKMFLYQNETGYLMVWVSVNGSLPEIIINPYANIPSKLAYYENAYDDELNLKANNTIKIIKYDFVEKVDLTIYE